MNAGPAEPRQDRGLYARSFVHVYDDWYGDLDDPVAVVDSFARRFTPPARIAEFGAGTGRLSTPLARAGFGVIALDISAAMLRQAPPQTQAVASDMAKTAMASGCVEAVLIAYNTLLNLESKASQRDCLSEAARVLRPGGLVAIENFNSPQANHPGQGLSVRTHPNADGLIAILTEQVTVSGQTTITGTHIELLPHATYTRPWRLSYLSMPGLDELAAEVGLVLVDRYASWDDQPFTHESDRGISWYRRDR